MSERAGDADLRRTRGVMLSQRGGDGFEITGRAPNGGAKTMWISADLRGREMARKAVPGLGAQPY